MFRNRLIPLCLIISAFSVFAAAQQSAVQIAQPTMTAEKWREDLRFMAERLPAAHNNLFHRMSKADFDNAVKQLDQRIPTLADHEVVVEIMRIVAMVGDGHTAVRASPVLMASGVYPVQFYMFNDGLYVRKAAADAGAINGGKVLSIDGVPVEEVLERVSQIVWRDNDQGIKDIAPWLLSSPKVLHALRISKSLEKVEVRVSRNNKVEAVELKPTAKPADLRVGGDVLVDSRDPAAAKPLWQKDPANNFWFEMVPDSKMLYVQFNSVQNKPNETVEAFFNKVFEYAEKNPADKLVIDLRFNGGGNNYLNLPVTIGAIRSRLNVKGKFFVIIGRETFSAAQNTVNDLEKYTNAVFVGEPTGARPNHYGDARPITLPNSKLQIQASTLWWQDKDPRDNRKWKAPHIAADMNFDDYRNGRDPAIEAILSYKVKPTLREIVVEARDRGDVAGFLEKYRVFKSDPQHKYEDTETVLNQVGHFLLGQKQIENAFAIFNLNAAENPGSAIVYQSLGDAHSIKGEKEAALTNYKKALKIDPKLAPATAAVKALEKN